MYLLINKDNSINYGNEHPVDEKLNFEGLKLIEFPEKSLNDVVGNVSPDEAFWDEENQIVIRNPMYAESEALAERVWRDKELDTVIAKLDQYDRDQRIPDNFRTSHLSNSEYIELLRYRKKLCEYPSSSNYNIKVRPILNK